MTNLSWRDRYIESLKEDQTIKGIMRLRNTSTLVAMDIRNSAIEYLKEKNPNYIVPKTKVPTEAVFAVTGHDQRYYYQKMMDERKANI